MRNHATQEPVKVQEVDTAVSDDPVAKADAINFFEKYLTVWVLLCMILGSLIGYYSPSASASLALVEFEHINGIVAGLLWVMILPMLLQIDFASLSAVRNAPGAIALTSVINYLIKPFSMYALAILFFRVFYVSIIPDSLLRDNYIAGLILLAGAPCTAMVFVWSSLTGGDPAYTLMQVAFNDLLMLAFYVPTAVMLIGVSNIELPWLTIIYAVLLFIVAPLVLAVVTRSVVISKYGEQFLLDRVIAPIKPFTVLALLATLVLIFIFQGQTIGDKPLQIVLIAIPIIIQCVLNWAVCYYAGYKSCIPHKRLAPASMIATSNFFELAVAVAISVYGLQSGAALATVVGVLVEVPVMLVLTHACNYLKPSLDARCANCPEICDWANAASAGLPTCCQGQQQQSVALKPSSFEALATSDIPTLSVTIYHNPGCETSCNALKHLRDQGHVTRVVEYLEAGWTREQLLDLFERSGLTARQALRDTKSPAAEMGLLDASVSDERLIECMLTCPVLVNRPFVVVEGAGGGAGMVRLCRPSESVLELLQAASAEGAL